MNASPSVLIVRLDAIGDALALVPLLAALRERDARIDVVLSTKNAGAFSKSAVDRVYVEEPGLADRLAQNGYDYALVATEDASGYRLARASGAPNRVGFQNGWGKPLKSLWARLLLTRTVYRTAGLDPRAPHECEVLFQLGADITGASPVPRDAGVLRRFVVDTVPPRDGRVVMQITDKWQRLGAAREDVARLARTLQQRHAIRFAAAESERGYAQELAAAGISVEYFHQLGPWKDAIASASAVVAPDSGAVHVAGMTGTPVVAAFAEKRFALQTGRWSPWAAPYKLVEISGDWPNAAGNALDELQDRAL
ncbi:MAG TPA: glycosyltransferase family 9 protein [Candidatus Rubrimentiphilum sp.]|nr:glycosyltransferase family 9 protein [Candidatus Rubrimentiphilum sp.]